MSSLLNRVIAHYSSHRSPQDAQLTCTHAGAGSVCRSRWSQRITQVALAVALGLGGSGIPLFLPSPAAPAAHAESVFEHRFDPSHPIADKADVLSQQQVQEASQKLTNIHSKRPFRFYIVFVKTAVPDASPTEVPSAPSSASPNAAPKPAGQTPEDKKRLLWAYQFTQKNHLDAYDALLVVETDTHQASLYHSPHGPLQNDEAQKLYSEHPADGVPSIESTVHEGKWDATLTSLEAALQKDGLYDRIIAARPSPHAFGPAYNPGFGEGPGAGGKWSPNPSAEAAQRSSSQDSPDSTVILAVLGAVAAAGVIGYVWMRRRRRNKPED